MRSAVWIIAETAAAPASDVTAVFEFEDRRRSARMLGP